MSRITNTTKRPRGFPRGRRVHVHKAISDTREVHKNTVPLKLLVFRSFWRIVDGDVMIQDDKQE